MSVIGTEKYPRGSRGSPAKGVVRVKRSEGSNPSFSATWMPAFLNGRDSNESVKKTAVDSCCF